MTATAWELQSYIYNHLANNPTVTSILGGQNIFDSIPPNDSNSCILIADYIVNDWSTATEIGYEHFITLETRTKGYSRQYLYELIDAINKAMSNIPQSLPSSAIISIQRKKTAIIPENKNPHSFVAKITFRIITEPYTS